MIESLAHFFSQPIQVQLISVIFFCYPLLAFFFFVAPFIAAFTQEPIPPGEWFPDRREKSALKWAVVLLPVASLMVIEADLFDWCVFALLAPSLCVFLTAIAGRRPFLYSLLVGFLFLASSTACLILMRGVDRLLTQMSIVENAYVMHFVVAAFCSALIAGLCLFLLWRCMDRNPAIWQAAPSE